MGAVEDGPAAAAHAGKSRSWHALPGSQEKGPAFAGPGCTINGKSLHQPTPEVVAE
jgi:hypothetical protein